MSCILLPRWNTDLQQRLQFVDTADAGQRGVLTDGVAAGDRTLDERALLAHLGHLRGGHSRHRDLGELRQEQHALGVVVVHTAGDQAGRVVAHHVQHREAQRVAGELVRGVPHLAGGLGPGAHLHAHALVLDALARERIDGLRRGQLRGRRHHQFGADARSDLDNLCATVDSDAVDPEVDVVARHHHAEEAGGPADQPGGGAGLPSVAVTTCCAAADSHMPCTIGDFSPASSAAARSVWIGLWSRRPPRTGSCPSAR